MIQNHLLQSVFRVCDILNSEEQEFSVIKKLVNVIPQCFQFSQICSAEILINSNNWRSPFFEKSKVKIEAELALSKGKIIVYYSSNSANANFIQEEIKFLDIIAQHVDNYFIRKSELFNSDYVKIRETDAQWRMDIARMLSQRCPLKDLGIIAIYLIGSVKSMNAGPSSDIDFLVHYKNENSKKLIESYFLGWDHAIVHENFKRTGYKCESIIELHLITDEDIKNKTSYAVMIGATENSALLLKKESNE